jgi:pimeloyl-ACP methyl ester carboxylesterase
MNVVVDGLMTSYQKTGSGPLLVMLHGWGANSTSFLKLADNLKDNYQILAPDLPGFGGTQTPDKPWGIKDYSEFIENWMSKLNVKPLAIIGHSFGGSIAAELAVRKGAEKLVLLASAGVRGERPIKRKLLIGAAKAGKLPLYLLPTKRRNAIKRKLYSSIGSDAMLLPHMEQTYRKIINEDIRPVAANIKLPTLLIYGSSDQSTPASDGRELHRLIKGSELKILNAEHFLHQEEAKQVGELIRQFLETKGA